MIGALLSEASAVQIIVAVVGAIALVAAPIGVTWITVRGQRAQKAATVVAVDTAVAAKVEAEKVAESVGPKNGHGTVQDATGKILDQLAVIADRQRAMERTQHAMQTSLDSVVDAASVVGQRLKAHDREIADLKRGDD